MKNCFALIISFFTLHFLNVIAQDTTFTIYHTGDIHAHFDEDSKQMGGIGRIITYIKQQRNKNSHSIYLDAGDLFTGTTWFSVYRWKIAEDFVKLLKVDAMCLGNHEFDEGIPALAEYLKNTNLSVVCSNAYFNKEPKLQPYVKPSVVLNVAGMKVGVIGYLNKDTASLSPVGKVTIGNEGRALLREIQKLKKQDVKVIIGLGHSGFEIDKTLAAGLHDIDVIIGGHTHTYLCTGPGVLPNVEPVDNYPTVVVNSQGRKVPIVHAYAYAKLVGKLSVTFNTKGELINFSGQPVLMTKDIEPDPEAVKLLKKYTPGIDALRKQVLGRSRIYLNGSCRFFECNLGNLLVDSFVHFKAEKYKGPYWTDTSVAIINGGSVRQSISPEHESGNITVADVYGSIPFDNVLISVDIAGSTLLNAIEHSVASDGNTSHGEFLQFSGVHVVYDLAKKPFERVESLKIRCANCFIPVYEAIDVNKTYKVVMNHYLAKGGDGFGMFHGEAHKIVSEPVMDVDILREYIKYYEVLDPRIEERIIIKNDKRKIILFNTGFKTGKNAKIITLSAFTIYYIAIK